MTRMVIFIRVMIVKVLHYFKTKSKEHSPCITFSRMSSKYDSAQILVSSSSSSSSSSYVLSRLAVAKLLAFVEIDPISATKAALNVKKSLVDANELVINHRQLFQKVLQILHEMEIRIVEHDARLIALYWKTRPLVIVVLKYHHPSETTSKPHHHQNTQLLSSIAQRLCDCAILDTNLLLQVNDVVSKMFPLPSSASTSDNNDVNISTTFSCHHSRTNVTTSSLAAESCRAFSRGGSLVASGRHDIFDENERIVEKIEESLVGKSFLTAADDDQDTSPNKHPACFVFVEIGDKKEALQTKSLSSSSSSLKGEMLQVHLLDEEKDVGVDNNDSSVWSEQVAKEVVGLIRGSLERTLF